MDEEIIHKTYINTQIEFTKLINKNPLVKEIIKILMEAQKNKDCINPKKKTLTIELTKRGAMTKDSVNERLKERGMIYSSNRVKSFLDLLYDDYKLVDKIRLNKNSKTYAYCIHPLFISVISRISTTSD